MVPRSERTQHVVHFGGRRVGRTQEPHIPDADGRQGRARLRFANLRQGGCLLEAHQVLAGIAAGRANHRNAPVVVQHRPGQVAGDQRLIIRVGNDDKKIGFETLVRRRTRDCGRRACEARGEEQTKGQEGKGPHRSDREAAVEGTAFREGRFCRNGRQGESRILQPEDTVASR